jgi:hypothetical protein
LRDKKGSFFFILDMFLASFILLITLIMIFSFRFQQPEADALKIKLDGFTSILFKSEISSYSTPVLNELMDDEETWPNPHLTMDEYVYYLYLKGYTTNATNVVKSLSSLILPSNIGLNYSIDGILIYTQNPNKKEKSDVVLSERKITFEVFNSTYYFDKAVTTKVEIWQ